MSFYHNPSGGSRLVRGGTRSETVSSSLARYYAVLRRQRANLLSLQSWFCSVSLSLHLQMHVETRGHPQMFFLGCHIPLFERRSLPPRCDQHGETVGKANYISTSAVQV